MIIDIRDSLDRTDKKSVYNFLVNESMVLDKSHRMMMEEGFMFYFPELYRDMYNDKHLDIYESFKEKLWHFLKDDYETYLCPVCGGPLGFRNIKTGYRQYCSNDCKYSDEDYLKRVAENTNKVWRTCDRETRINHMSGKKKKKLE